MQICMYCMGMCSYIMYCLQIARIMAVLQQQRQQQVGGTGVGSKLSPSHLGGGGPKMPMSDSLPHPGLGGSVADMHPKAQGPYSGEWGSPPSS